MASAICLPSDISVADITYSAPKNLDNGGRIISVYHKGKPLVIQTPPVPVPFGLNKYPSDKDGGNDKGPVKYSLELSFGKDDYMTKHPEVKAFFELAKALDNKFVEDAMNNSPTWFKKKYNSRDIVEALYTHLVKYSKDKETGEVTDKYPPTFRVQVPYKNGKFACEAYNKSRDLVPVETSVPKGTIVTSIVQCNGIWFAAGKFGVTFKVLQMKVDPPASIAGYAFIEDDDEVVETADA